MPWAAYPYNSWACIHHAAVAWSYLNILCVDVFSVSGLIKAASKILSKIQAADVQPSNMRSCLSACCPLVFEIRWAGAVCYQRLVLVLLCFRYPLDGIRNSSFPQASQGRGGWGSVEFCLFWLWFPSIMFNEWISTGH